jgi:hypothetical protein
MNSDIEYLKVSMKEAAEGEGKTLPPTGFRTITDAGVMNSTGESSNSLTYGVFPGASGTG